MIGLEKLVRRKQIISVVCNQWGDTGKGKIVELLAAFWADITGRGTGGNNAGHTTVVGNQKRIYHLIPSGIVNDRMGKINILGNGMVIDLAVLCQELDELDTAGMPYNNLMISEDAFVTLPFHVKKDKSTTGTQKAGGVGSTGRGIGPCYADKVSSRAGIMIRDLFNEDVIAARLKKLGEYHSLLQADKDEVMAYIKKYRERVKPFVRDTISEMQDFIRAGKRILLEGAQGLLLSSEFGTYPYETGSDCSANGTATGVGINARQIDMVLGIAKFPIMTRVGGGPFPTEFGGKKSEDYCAETNEDGTPTHPLTTELNEFGIPFEKTSNGIKYDHNHPAILSLINLEDDFKKGIGLRLAAEEYGATTGRPRRIGRTDLMALKYAVGINGGDLVLTKSDVMQGAGNFDLCIGYENLLNFKRDSVALRAAKPLYRRFEGFTENISQAGSFDELPDGLKDSIGYLEGFTLGKSRVISVGPERSQTIIR